ncbi:hypothetical protein BGW38_004238 [Lunasporangiospora selenospora]|uniref:Transmembrane protein 198 n=1 Tax=Lunasporangiospora selenospora TaxID=979761 RepID=A0A9P6FRM9_9FUNG|nr:hypothetical protein BGW38_004238 [Lunasporangiospora selenospora]
MSPICSILVMVLVRWDLKYYFFKPSSPYFWAWLLPGIVGAILSFRFWDLGVAFSGGFGGFALAMGINAASHNKLGTAGKWVILAILVLLGAAIATLYERFSIILGTSFAGASMIMYGIDEFIQIGYREILIILRTGRKSLVYNANKPVYIMLGCSLILAGVGIAWEFWHHAKPVLIDRRALFRIYGRPFGKRPRKLIGQRIKYRIRAMSWYEYLTGCMCLRRKTAEEVLFEDECEDVGQGQGSHQQKEHQTTGTTTSHNASSGEGKLDEKDRSSASSEVINGESSITTSSQTVSHLDVHTIVVGGDDDKRKRRESVVSVGSVSVVIEETDYVDASDSDTPTPDRLDSSAGSMITTVEITESSHQSNTSEHLQSTTTTGGTSTTTTVTLGAGESCHSSFSRTTTTTAAAGTTIISSGKAAMSSGDSIPGMITETTQVVVQNIIPEIVIIEDDYKESNEDTASETKSTVISGAVVGTSTSVLGAESSHSSSRSVHSNNSNTIQRVESGPNHEHDGSVVTTSTISSTTTTGNGGSSVSSTSATKSTKTTCSATTTTTSATTRSNTTSSTVTGSSLSSSSSSSTATVTTSDDVRTAIQ